MAKYYIPEDTEIGQRLLELSAIAGSLVNDEISSKKKIIDDLNDIIRSAKGLRSRFTLSFWKEDIDTYKVKEAKE